MFVATSNTMNIPPALLDRMEVIRLSGYTEDEKTSIAIKYLLPKQLTNNGLKAGEMEVQEDAVRDIVRYYTREAGVRSLEREISKICRKVVKGLLLKKYSPPAVCGDLADFLSGSSPSGAQSNKPSGAVVVWRGRSRRRLLTIEAALMPGKGVITRTGSLGDVMKESVQAAHCVAARPRLWASRMSCSKSDIHIHPMAQRPDGPVRCRHGAALVSALTGIPVRGDVAMTGDHTSRRQDVGRGEAAALRHQDRPDSEENLRTWLISRTTSKLMISWRSNG